MYCINMTKSFGESIWQKVLKKDLELENLKIDELK